LCRNVILYFKSFAKNNLNKVRNSKFYGTMIDKSTDVSVMSYIVVFACFIDDGLLVLVFLSLIQLSMKFFFKEIYEALLATIKE